MRLIEISQAEHSAGALSAANLAAAVEAVDQDGFLGLVGAVSAETCDRIYNRLVAEYDWLQANYGPFAVRGGGNYEGERYHGHEPRVALPWAQPDIVCNPFAIQVNKAMMGDAMHVSEFGANWALPPPPGVAPARQGVHGDAGPLFPGNGWTPPFIMNLSIPLEDFTEENGATEVWPGTHRLAKQLNEMTAPGERQAALEARRVVCPPERMVAPKGTVVIRDPRAWHAGMPNLTNRPRIMVAMRYYIFWMRNTSPNVGDRLNEKYLNVEEGSEAAFKHPSLIWRYKTVPRGNTDRIFASLKHVAPNLDRAAFDAAYAKFDREQA